jgi:hypothetical protein
MRIAPIAVVLSTVIAACSEGALHGGGAPDGGGMDGGRCVGDFATVSQGCAPMFDGTEANLPACRYTNSFARQGVWRCQDLIILQDSHGLGGNVCYYDATSHALVGAQQDTDTNSYCGLTSFTIEAGRTNSMCRENAPTIDRACAVSDGGT